MNAAGSAQLLSCADHSRPASAAASYRTAAVPPNYQLPEIAAAAVATTLP